MAAESGLLTLAQAVADGTAIDWDSAEAKAATPGDLQLVHRFRSLARIRTASQLPSWGPLEVRAPAGRGAFGTVHRAWDPRLEREVALKLLATPAGDSADTADLIREARLLARIRHPNVVTVHGADTCDGQVGIWMEFVVGRTLKDIVETQGPFSAAEAATIGRALCGALAAVHAQGILHRDVKPQNVMREAGGRIVLMDFGAGEMGRAADVFGRLKGTPAYLAPEVLSGQPPTVASDLFSVGVLLFYLVTGELPVTGKSLEDYKAGAQPRRFLRDLRPDLPAAFAHIVDRTIAIDPPERPSSAGELENLLDARSSPSDRTGWRWPALAAGVLVSGILGFAWIRGQPSPVRGVPIDSVAVLPFKDLSAGNQDSYVSDALTADLIAQLSAVHSLRVIAGASTARYKTLSKTPVEIGSELGVATVLDASVRRSQDNVRVVAQLIDASTGAQIWADKFDRKISDVEAMKSDVAARIAVALRGELSPSELEVLRPGRAYDYDTFALYSKGRQQISLRTEESLNRGVQYFHDALARDNHFAPAQAGLAEAYTHLAIYGFLPRREAFARAAAAAEQAVALDDGLAQAHAALGYARKNQFQWTAAEVSLKRALVLEPGFARAHQWYSVLLTQEQRFAEATAEIKMAVSLDPLSTAPSLQFASVLLMERRYDDAIRQYEHCLQLDAGLAVVYRHMANAYTHKREYAKARAMLDEAARRTPLGSEDQDLRTDFGYLDAVTGRRAEAQAIVRELTLRFERAGDRVAGSIADILAGLGNVELAIRWLERAAATPDPASDPELGYLKVDPRWDDLRADPRFAGVLERIGLNTRQEIANARR